MDFYVHEFMPFTNFQDSDPVLWGGVLTAKGLPFLFAACAICAGSWWAEPHKLVRCGAPELASLGIL